MSHSLSPGNYKKDEGKKSTYVIFNVTIKFFKLTKIKKLNKEINLA